MLKLYKCFFLVITLSLPQLSLANATKDAENIFDNFLLPMQLSALEEVNKVFSSKPELKQGLDFLNLIDLSTTFKNNRHEMVDLIKNNLSSKELNYLNTYLNRPEVKKYLAFVIEAKSFEKALTMLSNDERKVVDEKNPEIEASMTAKLNIITAQMKSIIAYGGLDALEPHRDAMEKIRPIDETCQKAFDAAIYNTAFLACGLGERIGFNISSKVFAKMLWRGDYLEKDTPNALAIYQKILSQGADSEAAFYYGVLHFNQTQNKSIKRKAACWIKLSAAEAYKPAIDFFKDFQTEYSDLPTQCKFIAL